MTTVTVYFCGTGSTKFDATHENYWNGELISTLAAHSTGREFAEWIVVDGPGSGNLQADEMFVQNKEYGMTGSLFGKGWEENVKHALSILKGKCEWQREKLTEAEYNRLKAAGIPIEDVTVTGSWMWRKYDYGNRSVTQQQLQEQLIKTFRKDGVIPTRVNLVGWSRGAVSCHMLANAMLNDSELKHIPVNIFAVDPVPGPLNFQSTRVELGKNVEEYVGFFARDERSKGFSCVVPETASNTRVHIYPMAGRHATLVGNAAPDGDKGDKVLVAPGMVVRHFAETCLTRWGVALDKRLNLSAADLEARHKTLVSDEAKYAAMHKYSYTKITESEKNERYASLGSKGVAFSAIKGAPYQPAAGLSQSLAYSPSTYKDIL